MVPTQILMDNYANELTGEQLTSGPEMKYWIPAQVAGWKDNKDGILANLTVPRTERDAFIELRRRFLKALHGAGVPILLGSDAPQLWNVPGFSAHRELQALVAAGLTPFQALETGTVNVARFLNEAGRSGVIRVGARADLVLLDANPLHDIANTMRISGVVVNGRWIPAAERDRLLAAFVTP
jgi:imidazolonepropionase-like amidohydrolase